MQPGGVQHVWHAGADVLLEMAVLLDSCTLDSSSGAALAFSMTQQLQQTGWCAC
jgi:hypothetical protein